MFLYFYRIARALPQHSFHLDEICNELECARYKAMYLAGASNYEKLSK